MTNATGMEQDKLAEERASGKALERFRFGTWEKQDSFKRINLSKAGLLDEKDKQILDFGCGPGTYGIILGRKNHVIGVDLAREAVTSARARAKRESSDFEGIVMDGDLQGLAPNSFDICLSAWALHHFPDIDVPLKQICYALKPGGKLVIIEPNERSIPQRISRFFENLSKPVVLASGLDTPNRSTHFTQDYARSMERNGLHVSEVFSHFNGEKPVLPDDILGLEEVMLGVAIRARQVLFEISGVLGAGAELFIVARKAG